MGTVVQIREPGIPEALYDLVFGFAVGDYKTLCVTAVNNRNEIKMVAFGEIPESIAAAAQQPARR